MSNIVEMINELCPHGVAYLPVCELTEMTAGDRITKDEMSDDMQYPAMGAGVVPTGWYSDWNREYCITISRAGAGAGTIGWQEGRFWATDVCFVAAQKENGPMIKYVFYAMKAKEKDLKTHIYGGSMPKIDKNYLWHLLIPVPPVEIQEEIVRILDEYEEKNSQLIAALNDELEARQKQYEYYRDLLLTFDDVSVTISGQTDRQTDSGELLLNG